MQIALLIFALLSVIGAFSAWRKSPLYSLRTAGKLLGAFLLIIAVAVGVTLLILDGPLSHSPAVQAVAGFIAVMALGSGFSILIVRITDSHVAQLPPSARLVTLHRHKVYRWIWRLLVYVLINACAAYLLPSSWTWLPLFLGGFVLLVCGPMLSILLLMAWRNDRGMSAVIAAPWAHWQYAPEKWAAWSLDQRQWEKSKEAAWNWKSVLLFVLFCCGLFAIGALASDGSLRERETIVAGLSGFVFLLAVVAFWFQRTNFDRRYRRLTAVAPESYFGDEGLFCNGQYTPWTLSGRYLLSATTDNTPPAKAILTFQSFNGSSSSLVTQRVLIPEGHLSDLPLLQQKLKACCQTATVHLVAS